MAVTLGDSSMALESPRSKIFLLILIPVLTFGMLVWLTRVAIWVVQSFGSSSNANGKGNTANLSADVLKGVMGSIQLQDGRLTRADYLEILLLSMKKVDPELVLALREEFQKTTHSGSLDVTRSELIESAAAAMSC
ncbi:MAG: hypothetical protein SGARI_003351, partial [Bacillariaceae sp.]